MDSTHALVIRLSTSCMHLTVSIIIISAFVYSGCSIRNDRPEEILWHLSMFLEAPTENLTVYGSPRMEDCPYGKAVIFNGINDAFVLQNVPLQGLSRFTIEVIMRPDSGGPREQRFLHIGNTDGDRVLLETRLTDTHWYFDGFVKSGDSDVTLMDRNLLHPLDQWYHVAYVCDDGKVATFVNGKKELEGQLDFMPLQGGKTSIGVRQNLLHWYKGAIFMIRITPKALSPDEFMPI
jgi:hypothetical protein